MLVHNKLSCHCLHEAQIVGIFNVNDETNIVRSFAIVGVFFHSTNGGIQHCWEGWSSVRI